MPLQCWQSPGILGRLFKSTAFKTAGASQLEDEGWNSKTKDQVPGFIDLWEAGRAGEGEKAEAVEAGDPE